MNSMSDEGNIFLAYSDESGCFSERYQVIAVITGKEKDLMSLKIELKKILDMRRKGELKFSDIDPYSPQVAKNFIDKSIEFAVSEKIRIDVLLWDTQDKRHNIKGRDEKGNLERMYYKVLRHVAERWGQKDWKLFPDENSAINWEEIRNYLNNTRISYPKPPLLPLFEEENYKINFIEITQQDSKNEPIIQLADLYAGLARFSRKNKDKCISLIENSKNRRNLFPNGHPKKKDDVSKADKVKVDLIKLLNDKCKEFKLGVSLEKKGYLWTPNPNNFINFWNYETQHDQDKAPVKNGKSR